jgi:hypothetical protein
MVHLFFLDIFVPSGSRLLELRSRLSPRAAASIFMVDAALRAVVSSLRASVARELVKHGTG